MATKSKQTRKRYHQPIELQRKIIDIVNTGNKSMAEVARKYNLNPSTVRSWVRMDRINGGTAEITSNKEARVVREPLEQEKRLRLPPIQTNRKRSNTHFHPATKLVELMPHLVATITSKPAHALLLRLPADTLEYFAVYRSSSNSDGIIWAPIQGTVSSAVYGAKHSDIIIHRDKFPETFSDKSSFLQIYVVGRKSEETKLELKVDDVVSSFTSALTAALQG